MRNKQLTLLLNYLCLYIRNSKNSGFTLIELLVAIIIASLIISSLLYLVIDILQTDNRESARNETQREMQMAMDYISNEIREAVYVYDGVCLQAGQGAVKDKNYCPGLTKYLPTFTNQTPILAFWKPEEIKDSEMPTNCNSFSTLLLRQQCDDLLVKRRAYTLVVYFQSKDNPGNKWKGGTRISRYALKAYTNPTTLTLSPGYADPSAEDGTTFQTWPMHPIRASTDLRNGTPSANNAPDVLVDFVDDPDAVGYDSRIPKCASSEGYIASPRTDDATPSSNSFFACVRSVVPAATARRSTSGTNQDVVLYLRGNTNGRTGGKDSYRLELQTQVLVRGVIDKIPKD